MIIKILRKVLILSIIILPLMIDLGCKKQPKCGCGKDMLFELDRTQARVYFSESQASFSPIDNPYATYYFCNPGEMQSQLADYKSGDLLLVSGRVYWNCSYMYQQSNYSYSYSYGMMYKVYDIQVSEVTTNLYGK